MTREHVKERMQTLGEEIANAVSHGVGAVACLILLPILITIPALNGDLLLVVANAVFGTTLVLLYLTSTMYHALPPSRAKDVWQMLDHLAIYLLIAGTYTPFALGPLRGPWGFAMLGIVWGLALFGIIAKLRIGFRYRHVSTAAYVAMGWVCVIAMPAVLTHVPPAALALLFAGGVTYTLGTLFFSWTRLRYNHFIWHMFVIVGTACHVAAVMWFAVA